jgi:hypothetical protein
VAWYAAIADASTAVMPVLNAHICEVKVGDA